MRTYVKPSLEYVVLAVEERFATGSGGCSVYGTCPKGTVSYKYHGVTYFVNNEAPGL